MAKKLCGLTGPSKFTPNCIEVIEKFLECDFVLLYHNDKNNLQSWLDRCDAFMVAGGVDIHPSLYMQNVLNEFNLSNFDFLRDVREISIIHHAIENKKPMICICRGHQLLGIYSGLGIDFEMDLSHGHVVHSPHKAQVSFDKENPMHYVELLDPKKFPIRNTPERDTVNSILSRSKDEKEKYLWVNSFHHQGLCFNNSRKYGEIGIDVMGVAPVIYGKNKKFVIELMQSTDNNWISSQWHPEWDYETNSPSRTVLEIFKNLLFNEKKKGTCK